MSRRRGGREPGREGLSPWATALVVLALGGVAAAVGLVVGSAGPRAAPAGAGDGTPGPPPRDASGELPAGPASPEGSDPADAGAAVFAARCAPCHTIAGGPAGGDGSGGDLAEAALRRDPRWVRAMIARPDSMFRADSAARRLLEVHGVPPSEATIDNPDLRALIAYLRAFDPAR